VSFHPLSFLFVLDIRLFNYYLLPHIPLSTKEGKSVLFTQEKSLELQNPRSIRGTEAQSFWDALFLLCACLCEQLSACGHEQAGADRPYS